jgi:adenylate kinase
MIIIVSGAVCTGKTTIAKELAARHNAEYIDVNKIISRHKLVSGYDQKRKCRIIDIDKLNAVLVKIIKHAKRSIVIDSHLSHYLPSKYVDKCIITKCSIAELRKRLKKRGYSKEKIAENIDAEIFDVCYNEAKEIGHRVKVIDTSPKNS